MPNSRLTCLLLLPLYLPGCQNPNEQVDRSYKQSSTPEYTNSSATTPPVDLRTDEFLHAKCVGVLDGDTIDILTPEKKQVRLRLASIDAPEQDQPFGSAAKNFLSDLVFGQEIEYTVTDTDSYDRKIAFVSIGSTGVNAAMIQQGLAWHYAQYSDDKSLARIETAARSEKRGLWADAKHVAPWDWRKLSQD